MNARDRPDPRSLAPREAVHRYLRRRRSDATDQSVDSWWYRLKLFVEWCEGIGISEVGDLRGYDLDEYYELRSGEVQPATLQGEMSTIKQFVKFLEQLEAVDDDLTDRVRVPNIDKADLVDETQLKSRAALPLLRHYRRYPNRYGTREHVLLELAWITGARQGAIRGLDTRDAYLEDRFVEYRHRPETGTPLKQKLDIERPVAIPAQTVDVIQHYLDEERWDVHDEHGRQPLLASTHGRPSESTIRDWMYMATIPCIHEPCPHGKEAETCEWTKYGKASKCPSSRSPHQVRTGSITWQLNIGLPPAVVAERVGATIGTIRQHYDQASTEDRLRRRRERMERDRRHYIEQIDLDENHDHDFLS